MSSQYPQFDFFALGEALIDFISDNVVESLAVARKFHVFVGGQPTNLTIAMSRLGKHVALAACVGDDGFGRFIHQQLEIAGVNTDYVQIASGAPTTLSINARQTKTPDFIIHRGADALLRFTSEQHPAVEKSRVVHTSAFALAREPARSAIIRALEAARDGDALVTLDPNYHPRIWSDVPNFMDVLKSVYQFVDLTKPSLDDCIRLFGSGLSPVEYACRFMEWGASTVIITMGSEGVFLGTAGGTQYHIHPNQVAVADVTGAGDAFWAGYLTSWLDGADPVGAARFGQVVAEAKLGVLGPISQMLPHETLVERARAIQYTEL